MEDEWEILPPDGLLEYRANTAKKSYDISSRSVSRNVPNIVIDANYFVCPASPPKNLKVSSDYASPVPVTPKPAAADSNLDRRATGEVAKVPLEVTLVSPVIIPKLRDPGLTRNDEADQDLVSQVSFKKMKENEFVDMKLDSPTKSYSTATRGFIRAASPPPTPPIDEGSFRSEAKDDQVQIVDSLGDKIRSPRFNKSENRIVEEDVTWEEVNNAGLNFWKWSLTGVGAICSFGIVAVATVCVLILGSHQKDCNQRSQKQNLRVQMYSDEQRIKHVVHHATKLNNTISIARGVPLNRTHITYGGYYDGL